MRPAEDLILSPLRRARRRRARPAYPWSPTVALRAAGVGLAAVGRRLAALPLRKLALVAALLTTCLVAAGFAMLMAPVQIADPPRPESVAQTSRILAADGSLLASVHGGINREPVALRELPRHVWAGAVASEDARFFKHSGIDFRAIARAAKADLAARAPVQGGSTITQQYAKSAYLGSERTFWRKLREARIAHQLERHLSKQEILERYLNTVYFGRGAYGIQAAAKAYFGKAARDLTVSESALLVGLIPSPGRYGPDEDRASTERRRVSVIDRMHKVGYLDAAEAREARAAVPRVVPLQLEQPARFGWFVDAVQRYLFRRYGADKVLSGGLQVRTTLDPEVQQSADAAVRNALPDQGDPHAAMAAVEPATGYVRALVGGREWGAERFNIAVQGRRQPGSAFKPFVLIAALENGISPRTTYRAPRSICLKEWKPACRVTNFGRRGFGRITLEKATVNSVNTVYAQLILDVRPKRVVDVAGRMGIPGPRWATPAASQCSATENTRCASRLKPLPALALGAQEVTPLELASAYATLAAGGIHRQPKLVEEIVDGSGKVLERGPAPGRRAISADVAAQTTHILGQVVRRGTGREADIGGDAAGKTGTTQDHRDAWFAGYTRHLASAVWVGHRDSNRQLVDIHGVRRVTGGTIPAAIWADFMTSTDVSVEAAPPVGGALAGSDTRYRLRVTNAGPHTAHRIVVTDELPRSVKFVEATTPAGECRKSKRSVRCRIDALDKGATAEVEVVVRPRQAGTLTHTAAASMKRRDANTANDSVTRQTVVAPAADLAVRARGPHRPVALGEPVTYKVTARNHGPSDATGVELSAVVPPGAKLVAAESEHGPCGAEGDGVVCRVPQLAAGRKVRATVVIAPGAAGTALSAVRARASETDPQTEDNLAVGSSVVEPTTDLSLRIEDVPEQFLANDQLRYRVVVSNAGPSPATGTEMTGRLPSRVRVVSLTPAQGSCTTTGRTFTCTLGWLPANAGTTVEVVASAADPGPVRLSAEVAASEGEADRANNEATVRTAVRPVADLGVRLQGPDVAAAGSGMAYVLDVWSHGPSDAEDVEVSVPVPAGVQFTGASGRGSCHDHNGMVVCHFGRLTPASARSATLTFRPTITRPLEIEAAVRHDAPDLTPANDRARVTTRVLGGTPEAIPTLR